MKQSHSWEGYRNSTSQEISRLLRGIRRSCA